MTPRSSPDREAIARPFWRGHGFWRVPNFLRAMRIDAPRLGVATAAHLHYRRLTIEQAARRLPAAPTVANGPELFVYFMSGCEHWAMTAFCAYSLLETAQANIVPVIVDDGKLYAPQRGELRRILPRVIFQERAQCEERLHRVLPESRYPTLHAMRRELPLMRKLLDLHAGQRGWRLFLDSDMLFLRKPEWMLRWLAAPSGPVYMSDFVECYGYTESLVAETLGRPVQRMVNTGFCGLNSESIDWDLLEHWAVRLHSAEGTNHYSEQCLTAMVLSSEESAAAPRDYLIYPSEEETRAPAAVMHHYVAESRTWYYIYGWPGVLRRARQ